MVPVGHAASEAPDDGIHLPAGGFYQRNAVMEILPESGAAAFAGASRRQVPPLAENGFRHWRTCPHWFERPPALARRVIG